MDDPADYEDDEQLKLAIALSMQEQSNREPSKSQHSSAKPVIDLTSDNEGTVAAPEPVRDQQNTSSAQAQGSGLLGLDRKAMEEERLARKRNASESLPRRSKPRDTTRSETGDAGFLTHLPSFTRDTIATGCASGVLPQLATPTDKKPLYPNGIVRKTWAVGYPRDEDMKFEEVLECEDLKLAVLSSFQWDMEWLLDKIHSTTIKMIFVMQAKEQSVKDQYERETAGMRNLRLCFPSMDGQVNCMHSKLMLLAHPSYLRIVLPTANLVPYDWGETGVMENMLFLIDLPRLPKDQRTTSGEMTFFGKELIYFCEAMNLQDEIVTSLYNFDFSTTKDIAFVHTIGGEHGGFGDPWRRTGYPGLGRAVKHLGLDTDQRLNVDFITSSLGAVNTEFLSTLYLAAQGDDGLKEFGWRSNAPRKRDGKPVPSPRVELVKEIEDNFRLYYPSQETVVRSRGGVGAGGTICFQSKWYRAPSFPQHILRDCNSTRNGMLMHIKVDIRNTGDNVFAAESVQVLYVRVQTSSDDSADVNSWAYIGSANCSESAWGKLVKDRATKSTKLNARNWESGVILPMRIFRTNIPFSAEVPGVERHLNMFKGKIPIPMQYPGEEFRDRQPWFSAEH